VARYLFGRVVAAVPVMLLVSTSVFLLLFLTPGDPVATMLGSDASPERVQEMRTRLGLDEPVPLQLAHWYGRLLQGDLGTSLFLNEPVPQAALLARMTRSVMLDTLGDDYIRTARSKGLREYRVLLLHAFRNALIPLATVLGLIVAVLLGGAVVTEQVFNIPGVGRLLVQAVGRRDYPLVQGVVLVIAAVYVVVNLAVDLAYGMLDPRQRRTLRT
jgi:ABC-type dipeptide/oligopeptide/nickel transport system permease component